MRAIAQPPSEVSRTSVQSVLAVRYQIFLPHDNARYERDLSWAMSASQPDDHMDIGENEEGSDSSDYVEDPQSSSDDDRDEVEALSGAEKDDDAAAAGGAVGGGTSQSVGGGNSRTTTSRGKDKNRKRKGIAKSSDV